MAADTEKEQQDMTPQEAAEYGEKYALSKGESARARNATAVSVGAWSTIIMRHNVLSGGRPNAASAATFHVYEKNNKEEVIRKVDAAIIELNKYVELHQDRKYHNT